MPQGLASAGLKQDALETGAASGGIEPPLGRAAGGWFGGGVLVAAGEPPAGIFLDR